jgi:hypothetical protein
MSSSVFKAGRVGPLARASTRESTGAMTRSGLDADHDVARHETGAHMRADIIPGGNSLTTS